MYIEVEKNNNVYEVTPNATPSANNKLYAFMNDDEPDEGVYFSSPIPPASKEDAVLYKSSLPIMISGLAGLNEWFTENKLTFGQGDTYIKVSDTEIIINGLDYGGDWHFYRDSEHDIEINVW